MVGIGAELGESGEVGKNRVGTADQLQGKQEVRPSYSIWRPRTNNLTAHPSRTLSRQNPGVMAEVPRYIWVLTEAKQNAATRYYPPRCLVRHSPANNSTRAGCAFPASTSIHVMDKANLQKSDAYRELWSASDQLPLTIRDASLREI